MARMHSPRLTVSCLLAVGFLASCQGDSGTPTAIVGARHVVLISLDTTRPDQFGLYGNEQVRTPNLDRLAAESIVFDDLMTAAPTTLAAHVSLMTGTYPQTHGTPRNGFVVHDDNLLLAEILQSQGFVTAGFAGSFALDTRFGFAGGFDHYDQNFDRFAGIEGRQHNERTGEAVTAAVRSWLDGHGVPERLFLFAHFFDAHAPYEAPAPFETAYDSEGRSGLPPWKPLGLLQLDDEQEVVQRMARQYAGEISYLDLQVGALIDDLRKRGILDDALLIVTSDHGENFWEHAASFDHGWNTYQTTMQAVGIVRLPQARHGGSRIEGVASTIDLLPSLLGFLDLDRPAAVEGEAISLDPPPAAPLERTRFGQATKPWQQDTADPRWANLTKTRCIRQGRYKLIQVPYLGTEELYDLDADPLEQLDLLPDADAELRELAEGLRARLVAWAESAQPLVSQFDASQREETLRRLEALGYVGKTQ